VKYNLVFFELEKVLVCFFWVKMNESSEKMHDKIMMYDLSKKHKEFVDSVVEISYPALALSYDITRKILKFFHHESITLDDAPATPIFVKIMARLRAYVAYYGGEFTWGESQVLTIDFSTYPD
jgi:hypothetical protein